MPTKLNAEMTRNLVDCAMGRKPADLVIRHGRWVCVQSGEVLADTDIAVLGERIAYVGPDATHTIGAETQIIDARGRYMAPGLLDGHMHIESSMLTITEFVRGVGPHGTTGIFIDPHEIANVFGLRGVRMMVEEAASQRLHVFVQMPSCVPSAPGMETPGAAIGPAEVAEAMTWPGIVGLGEMMNYPGVIDSAAQVHEEMAETRLAGKVISGHYPSRDLGLPFHGYAAGGPQDDHEGTTMDDAVMRIRQGMKVMMRYGSAWHDVAAQVKAVTEQGLDPRHFILCTDDSHSATLIQEGHMDRVIRHAIQQGLEPMRAIQMSTINTAEHFGLSNEIGMIAPGRYADIILVENLDDFQAGAVIGKGTLIAEGSQWLVQLPIFDTPDWALQSVHLKRLLTAEDFIPAIDRELDGIYTANVIGVIENQAPTRHLKIPVKVNQGKLCLDSNSGLAKIAVVERHAASGRVQVGLVHGFGLNSRCALATTVAHDSHHMIIVGTDDGLMAQAGNELVKCGGGQIVVKDGEIVGKVELPIAGLMSNRLAVTVAAQAETILDGFRLCGCMLNNPNMQLSLLGLVVIPELRISDLGLVDVNQFKFVPLIEP